MDCLEQPMTWYQTSDPYHPYQTDVNGQRWLLRLNDFPEEALYTLLIEGEAYMSFSNWPAAWNRPSSRTERDL